MNHAFITGMGRSGTSFVARCLSGLPHTDVGHERLGDREFWLLSWYLQGTAYATTYLERERRRLEPFGDELYVDVNGYLQNAVPALREVFPDCEVFHLVRDPRAVVRSLYSRRGSRSVDLVPRDDPSIRDWLGADKFSQICWNWASTTRLLLEQETRLIRLEDLTGDYELFRDLLLAPLGREMSREAWDRIRNARVNRTRSPLYRRLYAWLKGKEYVQDRLPPFSRWNDRQREVFEELCGELLPVLGYDSPHHGGPP